jgi:O-antigen ligase
LAANDARFDAVLHSDHTRAQRGFAELPATTKAGETDRENDHAQRDLVSGAVTEAVHAPRLGQIADGLAAAVAVSLPWSTSATGILIVAWIIAVMPTLDIASVRREVLSAAGGLPVLLWALGAVGMLWADVSWSERIAGLSGFHKLLLMPLLLAQFRRSLHEDWVTRGFLASSIVLLVVSWSLVLTPGLPWRGKDLGVPVQNYILQSAIFAICAFGLFGQAAELWRTRMSLSLVLLVLAAAFVANIGYVATARTTLVVLLVMLVLFGLRQFGWKGAIGACVVGGVLAGAVWGSSPYLRARVSVAVDQVRTYGASDVNTPVGLRLEYWKKSLDLITEAPLIGHGTGTIPELFRRDATVETIPALITTNPHSQILTVAVQLGILGTLVLIAMWAAHLALFRDGTLMAWFGLVLVTYNIVSSFFNSHLFDFGQGWLYVFGVGLTGGVVLRGRPGSTDERVRESSATRHSRADLGWRVDR